MLGAVSCGRGVLSMSALSYGVIRVDQENSLTSLTLQDCGQIMPGGMNVLYIIKLNAYEINLDIYFECLKKNGLPWSKLFDNCPFQRKIWNTNFLNWPLKWKSKGRSEICFH